MRPSPTCWSDEPGWSSGRRGGTTPPRPAWRVRAAMGRAGVRDPDRYRERLETDAAVLDDLVVELTVGETYFFREPAQFQFLRREALPDLWRLA